MRKYLSLLDTSSKFRLAFLFVIAVISAYLGAIVPVKSGELLDNISVGKIASLKEGLVPVGILAFLLFFNRYLFAFYETYIQYVLSDILVVIRTKSLNKILRSSVDYHAKNLSGERVTQISRGLSAISALFPIVICDIPMILLTIIFSVYQVIKHAPTDMIYTILLYSIALTTVAIWYARNSQKSMSNLLNVENHFSGELTQSIQNIEFIRSQSAFKYEERRLKKDIKNINTHYKKFFRYVGVLDASNYSLEKFFEVSILLISLCYIQQGRMSAGNVITIVLLFKKTVESLMPLAWFARRIVSSSVESKQLLGLLTKEDDKIFDIKKDENKVKENDFISFKDLLITSPDKKKILAKFDSIVFDKNKYIALRGATGAGKTTLIRALTRYYPYTQGKIVVFGKDLNLYTQKELTDTVYYVPQSPFFFKGTIKENLVYGLDKEFSNEELYNVLKKTCLIEDEKERIITSKEKILDYNLQEGATNISGGQRQRLSIARTFLKNPKLYIFDESTSNVDEKTQEVVLSNIEEHAKNINAGIVYISHSESVVSRCDEVITLNNLASKNLKEEKIAENF